jgi:hypothetical protein
LIQQAFEERMLRSSARRARAESGYPEPAILISDMLVSSDARRLTLRAAPS